MSTLDLFEPQRKAELSQFFTPAWLARKAASWIEPKRRVFEPNAGSGNLIAAYLATHRVNASIAACEVDPEWAAYLRKRFPYVRLIEGDFLGLTKKCLSSLFDPWPRPDIALMNPPYEDGQDVEHVARALELFGDVIAIVKSDFEFGVDRDRVLWRHARVVRRGMCVDRPQFGEFIDGQKQTGAARNYVALRIVPASDVGGAYRVDEERWRRSG